MASTPTSLPSVIILLARLFPTIQGFPLTQLNVFLGVAWGVLCFKEAASARSIRLILLAAVMALAGSVLLAG